MSEDRAAFYRRLLTLSGPEEADRLLGRAVELLARQTGAELAYLEILDLGDELRLGYSAAGLDLAAIRARISPEMLCVPLDPIAGVLYLHKPAPFSPAERDHAARCAGRLGEQLLRRHGGVDRLELRRALRLFHRRATRRAVG